MRKISAFHPKTANAVSALRGILLRKKAADANTFTDATADAISAETPMDNMSATAPAPAVAAAPNKSSLTLANPVGTNSLATKTHNNLVQQGQGYRSPFATGSR